MLCRKRETLPSSIQWPFVRISPISDILGEDKNLDFYVKSSNLSISTAMCQTDETGWTRLLAPQFVNSGKGSLWSPSQHFFSKKACSIVIESMGWGASKILVQILALALPS